MQPQLIYIAGPISAETNNEVFLNVINAMDVANQILRKGHYPVIPHLLYFFRKYSLIDMPWCMAMCWDDAIRQRCDSMLFLGSSLGSDIEHELSWNEGHRIYYSVDEIESMD